MPENLYLIFNTEEIMSQLLEVVEEQNFLTKDEKLEGLSLTLYTFLENQKNSSNFTLIVQQNLDWIEANYSAEFLDVFCLHLIDQTQINGAEIWKALVNYIFDSDKLTLTRRKINNFWKNNKFEGADYLEFKRIIFQKLSKNAIERLKVFLSYYYQDGSSYAKNLWSVLEIQELLKDAVNLSNERAVYKIVSDKLLNLYINASTRDPEFVTDQLDLFIFNFEKGNQFQSVNSIRASRTWETTIDFFKTHVEDIQTGKEFLNLQSFQQYGRFFQANETNADQLNISYNRFNKEINYILAEKAGIKDLTLADGFFNLKEFEKTNPDFSYRISFEKIKNNLVEELWNSFDLSFSQHIANTCFDFLAITYYKLIQWRKDNFSPSPKETDNSKVIWTLVASDYTREHRQFISQTIKTEIFPENDNAIEQINERWKDIASFKVLERIYDLENQKVQEKVQVAFRKNESAESKIEKEGEFNEYTYVGPLPFRYYNLLTVDITIFDSLAFSFFERNLDYLNDNLIENVIDSIFQNKLNALGFLATNFLEDKPYELVAQELYLNHPRSEFNLLIGSPGFNIPAQPAENYFEFLFTRNLLPKEMKDSLAAEFADHESQKKIIFIKDGSIKLPLLNEIYKYCADAVSFAPVFFNFYNHAAQQTSRLDIIRTPGDLEFTYNTTQRNAISAKNKYRGNIINNMLTERDKANETMNDLSGFYPVDSYFIGSIVPSIAFLDFEQKKVHCITILNSSNEIRSWYYKNEYDVDEEFIRKIYLQVLVQEDFFEKFKIDLSGVCKNGPRYFLQLLKYLEHDDFLNDKFNKHCLDFFETIQNSNIMGKLKPGHTYIENVIKNKNFEKALQLNDKLLVKEKDFLSNFFGFPYTIGKYTSEVLHQFTMSKREKMVEATAVKTQEFNVSFEPQLDAWNGDEFSITVGDGAEGSYFIINMNTGGFNLIIPSPSILGYDSSTPKFSIS